MHDSELKELSTGTDHAAEHRARERSDIFRHLAGKVLC